MDQGSGRGFMDRVFSTYRQECRDLAGAAAGPEGWPLPDGNALAQGHRSDALVRYVLGVQPAYDAVRRAIGHIGGILVLLQLSGRRDAQDRSVLAAARDHWQENDARLGSLAVPDAATHHFADLRHAHRIIGEVLDDLISACRLRPRSESFPAWSEQLKHAYLHLQRAAVPDAGMAIVDHRHSCCRCLRDIHERTPLHG